MQKQKCMKQSKFAALLILAFGVQAQAFDYKVSCHGKKNNPF